MSRDTARPPYTGAEVAELFNVHPATVIRWAEDGKIPCFRTPGGQRRYPRAAIDALLGRADVVALAAEAGREVGRAS